MIIIFLSLPITKYEITKKANHRKVKEANNDVKIIYRANIDVPHIMGYSNHPHDPCMSRNF